MNQNSKIKHVTITATVGTDRSLKFVLGQTIPIGSYIHALRTRRAGANRKTLQGKAIVNDVNFEAASITLKVGTNNAIEKLFFEHIEKASNIQPQIGFPVNLLDVNWDTSFIEIEETVVLNTGNAFELTISYTEPK